MTDITAIHAQSIAGLDLAKIYKDAISLTIENIPFSVAEAIEAGNEMLNGNDDDDHTMAFYTTAMYIYEEEIIFESRRNDSLSELKRETASKEAFKAYESFMVNEPDKWQGWIEQNFGSDWGFIAKVIIVCGR